MKKLKEYMPSIKKMIGIGLILFAVIFSFRRCYNIGKSEEDAQALPQITSRKEMKEALSRPKEIYAVLNAPVSGTPVKDPFDILTDEYIYINYSGE
ncbi:MAG: hypothetical protein MSJ26_03210 [Oscillospiraceae bacterium]|nr:hypothetical protein [Oscillospiraceae bacterium]